MFLSNKNKDTKKEREREEREKTLGKVLEMRVPSVDFPEAGGPVHRQNSLKRTQNKRKERKEREERERKRERKKGTDWENEGVSAIMLRER